MSTQLQYVTTDRLTGQDLAQAINALVDNAVENGKIINSQTAEIKTIEDKTFASVQAIQKVIASQDRVNTTGASLQSAMFALSIFLCGCIFILGWQVTRLQKQVKTLRQLPTQQGKE